MLTEIKCPTCQTPMQQLFGANHAGCFECGAVKRDVFAQESTPAMILNAYDIYDETTREFHPIKHTIFVYGNGREARHYAEDADGNAYELRYLTYTDGVPVMTSALQANLPTEYVAC